MPSNKQTVLNVYPARKNQSIVDVNYPFPKRCTRSATSHGSRVPFYMYDTYIGRVVRFTSNSGKNIKQKSDSLSLLKNNKKPKNRKINKVKNTNVLKIGVKKRSSEKSSAKVEQQSVNCGKTEEVLRKRVSLNKEPKCTLPAKKRKEEPADEETSDREGNDSDAVSFVSSGYDSEILRRDSLETVEDVQEASPSLEESESRNFEFDDDVIFVRSVVSSEKKFTDARHVVVPSEMYQSVEAVYVFGKIAIEHSRNDLVLKEHLEALPYFDDRDKDLILDVLKLADQDEIEHLRVHDTDALGQFYINELYPAILEYKRFRANPESYFDRNANQFERYVNDDTIIEVPLNPRPEVFSSQIKKRNALNLAEEEKRRLLYKQRHLEQSVSVKFEETQRLLERLNGLVVNHLFFDWYFMNQKTILTLQVNTLHHERMILIRTKGAMNAQDVNLQLTNLSNKLTTLNGYIQAILPPTAMPQFFPGPIIVNQNHS